MDISGFEDSYQDFLTYPLNILDNQFCLPLLRAYTKKLNETTDRTFVKDDDDDDVVDMLILDLKWTKDSFERTNILHDCELRRCLGDTYNIDAQGVVTGAYITKPDPLCRYIIFQTEHSRAPLWLTKDMFARILSFHQIMPSYLDFLFLFGERVESNDLKYAAFRKCVHIEIPIVSNHVDNLGRSGQQYQLCYNLKTIAIKWDEHQNRERQWSIRQAVVYHQFDIVNGRTLWIMTTADRAINELIQEMTNLDGENRGQAFATPEECFRSSITTHTGILYHVNETWRHYTQNLENVVESATRDAVLSTRTQATYRKQYLPEDLQQVQYWEEKCREAEIILYGNNAVLSQLRNFYLSLSNNPSFSMRNRVETDIKTFVALMFDVMNDATMHMSRMRFATEVIAQRKQLIVQHLQSQEAEDIKTLLCMLRREAHAI